MRTLLEDGYLDDGRFALMFIHDRRELDGWGSERIRRELAAKGVGSDLIETALEQHEAEWRAGESELDRALTLLRRRFPSAPRERRDRDRALGVLIRKGFDSELALDALAAHARSQLARQRAPFGASLCCLRQNPLGTTIAHSERTVLVAAKHPQISRYRVTETLC